MGIIIGVLVLVLAVLLFGQISILQKEANKIRSMNVLEDQVDMRIHTSDNFAVVEKLIKTYIDEYVTEMKEVTAALDDETFADMLSEHNIVSDGPEFFKSREWLKQARELIVEDFKHLGELAARDSAAAAVKEAGIGGAYAKLGEYYITSLQDGFMHTDEEFEAARRQIEDKLDEREKILNFLTANKEHWKCENGKLTFETSELSERYNELIVSVAENKQ